VIFPPLKFIVTTAESVSCLDTKFSSLYVTIFLSFLLLSESMCVSHPKRFQYSVTSNITMRTNEKSDRETDQIIQLKVASFLMCVWI